MSILDEMEASLHSDSPVYMDFLYRYDPKKKQAFVFYEGDEDSSYYHRFLSDALSKDFCLEEIIAGCKQNVLKIQREFDWTIYSKKKILFIVDRDLSFWLGEPDYFDENVFVTDGYSVENYIANSTGLTAWLIHFQGFARAKPEELNSIILKYRDCEATFQSTIMRVMAKAVVAKRHDRSISLDDYKLSNKEILRFSMENNTVTFELCEGKLLNDKWHLNEENSEEIEKQITSIISNMDRYSVRGKWMLYFMAAFGEYVRLHAAEFAPSLGVSDKASQTCSVHPSQCFVAIAPYCTEEIPPSLDSFLQTTYRSLPN